MKEFVLLSGAVLGALAVIFGAFGAHALKKIFTNEQVSSFETGVKYQMYHALVLLVLGLQLEFTSNLAKVAVWCFLVGTILFSFSIYGLNISAAKGRKMRFLGPVTPLGGLFLLTGWILLAVIFAT